MINTVLIILALLLVISIYVYANFYIFRKAYDIIPVKFAKIERLIFIIISIFLSTAFIVSMLTRSIFPLGIRCFFTTVGSYWIAMFYYLIILLPLTALIRFFLLKVKIKNSKYYPIISRIYGKGALVFIFVILLIVYGSYNAKNIKIREDNITVSKSSKLDNLKVAFVSDIHLGAAFNIASLNKAVDKINEQNPDVIILGGDIVDENTPFEYFDDMSKALKRLKSKFGTYAILGNHERGSTSVESLDKYYEAANCKLLIDSYVKLGDIVLVGINDVGHNASTINGANKSKSFEEILPNNSYNKKTPILVMKHQPNESDVFSAHGADLEMSGHTHAGQFFPNLYLTQLQFKYSYGFYKENNMNVIVSSGLGTWGPPIRIGTSSEIEIVNIKFNGK